MHYTRDHYRLIDRLCGCARDWLMITRTPFIEHADDFVVVQRPHMYGYMTEYPGWFMNRAKMLDFVVARGFELVRQFLVAERPNVPNAPEQAQYYGFLFRRRAPAQRERRRTDRERHKRPGTGRVVYLPPTRAPGENTAGPSEQCGSVANRAVRFSDNAKSSANSADVEAVRTMLRTLSGFAATHIVCRKTNFGLARNITDGVTAVLAQHESVIVVEDDIVVSPFFLRFMNEALQNYRDVPRVGSISGYCYPVTDPVPETYFIRGADCWGWATWRDRWRYYNPDSGALAAELESRNLLHAFDFDGEASFSQMLKDHIAGKNDSWAIRWHASCYLRDLLILYPGRALAQNIGRDGSGTHSAITDEFLNVMLSPSPIDIGNVPVEENTQAREAIKRFFMHSASKRLTRCQILKKRRQSAKNCPCLNG